MKTERSLAERLPPDLVLGVATSAYQIEGATDRGGRGVSIWDRFAARPGAIEAGESGEPGCDHYRRWAGDLDLMRGLGIGAYRFSVSWARLQPDGRGPLNPEGVNFYRDLIAGLRERGIRPFLTLYHWDLPQDLEDSGGWPSRETAHRFGEYAGRVAEVLGDGVEDWITLNEPWCSAFLGYGSGAHAPGRIDAAAAVAAGHHLNLAHGLATAQIRAVRPVSRVGISNLVTDVVPGTDSVSDRAAASRLDAQQNRFFLGPVYRGDYDDGVRRIYEPLGLRDSGPDPLIRPDDLATIGTANDFVGLNHYHRIEVRDAPDGPHPLRLSERHAPPAGTAMGWSVCPDSLLAVLQRVRRDYTALPIHVTENGAAFDDHVETDGSVHDPERTAYLAGYLDAVARATESGVDVAGYFAWSLLDNFEWAFGYAKRFGLVHVDFATQRRTVKSSGRWFAGLLRERAGLRA